MKKWLQILPLAGAVILQTTLPTWAQNPPKPPAPPSASAELAVNDDDSKDDAKNEAKENARQAKEEAREAREEARQAAEEAKRDAEEAAREAEDAGKEAAQSAIDAAMSMVGFGGSAAAAKPLVVRTAPMDGQKAQELQEDIAVMGRILEKAVNGSEGRRAKAMGIHIDFPWGRPSAVNPVYLDGYGLLYQFNTDLPLLPISKKDDEKKSPKEESSAAWEEAKSEIRGKHRGGAHRNPDRKESDEAAEIYSAAKVDRLKQDILIALKNGSHIRNLKADEFITVLVSRGGRKTGPEDMFGGGDDGEGKKSIKEPQSLVIRVKKTLVDAYAADSLKDTEFAKQASTTIY